MQKWRRSAFGNPANWFMLLGTALLGLTVWVPVLTARRTERVESRADEIAQRLLHAAQAYDGDLEAADAPVVFARMLRLALRDDIHVADLEALDEPLPGTHLTLRNKHYAFHVADSPLEENVLRGRNTLKAREVLAWPLSRTGPGHCAFFLPDDAPRAFTRNLSANHVDLGSRRPQPGRCHRRPRGLLEVTSYYRSFDDERWILY